MYIYCITNRLNFKKYIGCTIKSTKIRFIQHVSDSKKRAKYPIHKAIRKYGIDNFSFRLIDSADSIEEMYLLEKYYIKEFQTIDSNLGYNCTSGGDGIHGYKFSDEVKQKLSVMRIGKNNPMYGKKRKHTEETKRKMSLSSIGKNTGKDNVMYGKIGKLNPNSKMIIQIDKDTDREIATYFSMTDVNRELGIGISCLSSVCSKRQKTAGGFKWKYKNDFK